MSQPVDGEELYLYLVASTTTVSANLVRSDEDDKHKLVYFVSTMLIDVETRYTDFERIALALCTVAKRLCPYFHVHNIVILTSYPIRAILHKPDDSGRLLKWAIDLSEFDIEYHPRSAIKGQALVDFIVEMSDMQPRDQPRDLSEKLWILENDESSRAG